VKAVGLDIVATERIHKALNRFGDRFARRILGAEEWSIYTRRRDRAQFVAGRFAAKEAIIKALGRFLTQRPAFGQIQVVNDAGGQPEVVLPEEVLRKLTGHRCLVSITHEKTNSAAVAVIVEEP